MKKRKRKKEKKETYLNIAGILYCKVLSIHNDHHHHRPVRQKQKKINNTGYLLSLKVN